MTNKHTVHTTQHDDQFIRHMRHGCNGHSTVTKNNSTLHYVTYNLTKYGVCLFIKQPYRWIKLHNVDLYDLQLFPYITRILLGWSNQEWQDWHEHVAQVGEKTDAYMVWLENLKERGCIKDQCIEGNITLRDLQGRVAQCEVNWTGLG